MGRTEPADPQSWNSWLGVSSLHRHGIAPEPDRRAASLRLPSLEGPRRPKPRQSWGQRAKRRWRKSKTRRSTSSPQIHQKYIYTWNCSYRTPTERWQKTSDLPKGKKLPTYLGRAKEKKKKQRQRIGTGPAPVGGSCEGGKVSTH